MQIELNVGSLKVFEKIETAAKDTTPLMKQIGALNVEASQNAFNEQKFGKFKWPERYPNQRAPKLNVAGALSDFNAGKKNPKPIRFEDRPALMDTGHLQQSITFQVLNSTTEETGTTKPYANLHQQGGKSTQPVTNTAKEGIADWLWTPSTSKGPIFLRKFRKGRAEYAKHLVPLLFKSSLVTNVNKRPFIGMTDELMNNIIQTIIRYFSKPAKGTA